MACDPHWNSYLSALLTPIVAALGLFIAYRQWHTARDKLKHELFDRRFSIYEAARDLCWSISESGKLEGDECARLSLKAMEAKWLLNDDISKYLESLCDKAVEVSVMDFELEQFCGKYPIARYLSSKLQDVPEEDREQILLRRRMLNSLVEWFHSQDDALNEKFSPFLTLNH